MLTPLALFVGLLLATAFIAHWSDNLGKKLGKKRVSVFGLRPRTSATLLTVASSWVIMIFTLAALLIVVPQLSRALFHYERDRARFVGEAEIAKGNAKRFQQAATLANQQKEDANQQKAALLTSVATAHHELTVAQGEAKTYQEQEKTAQHNFRSAQRGEQSAKRGAKVALGTAKVAKSNAQQARIAASTAHSQEQAARSALEKAKRSLGVTQGQLAQNQKSLEAIQTQYNSAKPRVIAAYQKVVASYQALAKSNRAVAKANDDLAKANAELAKANTEVTRAQREVDRLQKQAQSLQERIRVATLAANQFGQLAEGLAFNDIRLPVDTTLAERRFDATRNPQEIERELHILVDEARGAVKEFVPKADFVVGAAIADKATGNPIDLNEDQAIQIYATTLASANQSFSARLTSAFNYPSTTSVVAASFVFIPIRTIYTARETIGQGNIDAGKSESAIFGDLQRLVDEARRSALKRGARPPLSPAASNFFDGDTGQKLFDALRQVQKVGHPVQVRVVAARDLDAAEPLQVRFVVGDGRA